MKHNFLLIFLLLINNLFAQNKQNNIEFIFVEGGTFTMGSNSKEKYRDDDETAHFVTVFDFKISKTEITHKQYISYLNSAKIDSSGYFENEKLIDLKDEQCAVKYSNGKFIFAQNYSVKTDNYPIIEVTWFGAFQFAKYYGYRLPTEAEWEYVAKGGNLSKGFTYAGSDNYREVAVFVGTSKGNLKPVASMLPNELGIFDMSGNVWEWCEDWYSKYSTEPQTIEKDKKTGQYKILKGGSWNSYGEDCRNSFRGNRNPKSSGCDCGFRVVK